MIGSGSGEGDPAGFSASRERFDSVIAFLDGATGAALSHAEMEERLTVQGRDLLRQLYQDHLDLRAEREGRVDVVEVGGADLARVEPGHRRALQTVFGVVQVHRLAYRAQIDQMQKRHRQEVQALRAALEQAHGESLDLRRELARRRPPSDHVASIAGTQEPLEHHNFPD